MQVDGTQPSLKSLYGLIIALALVLAAAVGSYYATAAVTLSPKVATDSGSRPQGVDHLMIFEPMNSMWNSTTAQPKFDLMGPDGLSSAENFTVPANVTIQFTIVSYDSPTPGSADDWGVVKGTLGGVVYMINGSAASMGDEPLDWGMNMSAVSGADLAHTFTIPELGVNIPVVGGDTQVAYLRFTRAGTYTWVCLTPCGFGANGMQGAMSAAGWMFGQITVK